MGKLAFVFAGQGAQHVGMGRDLYEYSPAARRVFDEGEASIPGISGICFNGPAEALNHTENTQPCLFLADLACAEALAEKGLRPDGAAGFSLGEIPAVCFAGIMPPAFALEFTKIRAEAMRRCAEKNPGAMYAIMRLIAGETEEICAGISGAYPVNYNCPGQTVVACAENDADKLQKRVTDNGGKALKLAVSGAFHGPFMNEANKNIAEYLADKSFGDMKIPLYSNFTAKIYGDPKKLLARQVNSPVLWQKNVENMITDNYDTFIEVGPGKTLSGLIRKINADARIYNVSDLESLENTVRELQ